MTWSKGSEFENSGNKINWRNGKNHRMPSVMSSLVVTLPVNNTRVNRRVIITSPTLDMKGFWPVEFLLLNNH
jgi:hypothetical protein